MKLYLVYIKRSSWLSNQLILSSVYYSDQYGNWLPYAYTKDIKIIKDFMEIRKEKFFKVKEINIDKDEFDIIKKELDKILYVEGLKDYVKIYVENEPHPILSLMSLKSLEDVLPSDRFIRVHRSFIVQTDKIKIIERNRIVFGKQYIPISDSYKSNFQAMINQRSITGKS